MVSLPGTTTYITGATAAALQSVSEQNNEGVSLYNQGRFAEAIHVFKDATSASKNYLSRPMDVERATSVELSSSLQVLPSRTALTSDIDSLIDHSTVYLNPFEAVVTSGGLQIMEDLTVANCQHRLLFSRLSTILIFNMALTHHAIAMMFSEDKDSTSKREFLSKARHLYNLAYSIPQGEQEQEIIDESMLPLFVKAILNNLGHCFSSLGDINKSNACYELLLQSIILFQQDHIQCRNLGESKECFPHHTACFWNNTIFLILKDPGLAPAA
ncbi:expressed tetratricopeptide repeat protein [Nitzschia inconspicua]|uniref:Expressed tetratricopeptide repeat protein n=1 Tax=Nitzschia inconspicua TaxID=303405 RepID=A0A9K3KH46_9STRA|nr:expressed tetratricopeptide repeat protein [Nitzschia inconspicua]